MIIGTDPTAIKEGDTVTLKHEQRAGKGKVLRVAEFNHLNYKVYFCVFEKRDKAYFVRDDLHCKRVDGDDIKLSNMSDE